MYLVIAHKGSFPPDPENSLVLPYRQDNDGKDWLHPLFPTPWAGQGTTGFAAGSLPIQLRD